MSDQTQEGQKPTAPQPGTPEYDKQMAESYDKRTTVTQPGEPKPEPKAADVKPMPEGGSEKYYDKKTGAYNWEGHAKEAEFRLKQKGVKAEPGTKPADQSKTEETPKDGEQKDDALDFEIDWQVVQEKIRDNGDLDPDDYEALEEAGFSKDFVKTQIENYHLAAEGARLRTEAYVGGKDKLDAMLQWAASSLPEDEKARINGLLASKQNWQSGLDLLKTKFEANAEGSLITGGGSAGGVAGFASRALMSEAINDPRYKKDPVYRASVERRIAATR